MAGVVQSTHECDSKLSYEKILQLSENNNSADLLLEIKELIEKGDVVRLNRSITDTHLTALLEKNKYFKNEILPLSNLHLNFEAYSTITDTTLINLMQYCPNLKKINLKSCASISDRAVIEIAKNCPELEEIDLSWCDISEKSLKTLAIYSKKLKKIGVRSCYITDSAVDVLLENCKELVGLSFAWCKSLTDKAIQSITERCPQVEILDIRGNERITGKALSNLFIITKNLRTIHLKRCPSVNNEVLLSVASHSPLLEKLNLRGCYNESSISNETIIAIANHCPNLKFIDLAWHDYLNDKALLALSKQCPNLTAIDLSGCYEITDQSLIGLVKNCNNIRKVILFNNPNISNKSVAALREKNVDVKQF